MSALIVEVDGRVLRLVGKPVYRIGRAIEADVVLTAGSVSRQHAELRVSPGGTWALVDTGSQFGTYVGDERISEYPLEQSVTVRCGPPSPGATLTIVPAEQYDDSATPPSVPAPPPPMPAPGASPDPTQPPFPAMPPTPAPAAAQPGSERFAPGTPPPPGAPAPGFPTPVAPATPVPAPAGGRPAGTPGMVPGGVGEEATQILAAMPGQFGPGGPAAQRTGPDLLLVAEGREHRFRHPAVITVGRRADSTVVITDPACSREHGRIDGYPGGWTYTNLSNEGTYLEGRRVTTQQFDERLGLRLGHPVAGPELTLVPILSAAEEERRFAKRRMRKRLVRTGVAALALLLVGGIGLGFFLVTKDEGSTGGGDEPTDTLAVLTAAELDTAKAATVKITAEVTDLRTGGQGTSIGSGSIISSDGLILTNAHVAAPETPGLAERYGEIGLSDPDYLSIHLTDPQNDKNAPAAYRARVVKADGYLDVAVIQIYADADGNDIDGELDLPTVPMGDSEDLRTGDQVTVLGFPVVAGSGDSITVTKGVISNVNAVPELGDHAELDTDARIAPGNSGGMAVNNDAELIGIPSAVKTDERTAVASGRIRSIDAVKELIKEAEDEVD